MNHVEIKMVQGKSAPKYDEGVELTCDHVAITEQATASNLPLVDFVLKDGNGNKFLFVLTGRLVNAISAAIKGANVRNHGVEEP